MTPAVVKLGVLAAAALGGLLANRPSLSAVIDRFPAGLPSAGGAGVDAAGRAVPVTGLDGNAGDS